LVAILRAMRAVVTGANRGIGLELVRQLKARGDEVEACAREPEEARELKEIGVRVHRVDVRNADNVRALASSIGDAPVDLLFNVAGVNGGPKQSIRQMAEDLELRDVIDTFDVNAVGALRVAVALLPALRRGTAKKIVNITSGMGSITDNGSGGYYAYRMSKAALNMASKSLAVDLKGEGIISFVINPGWVQTDMGGRGATISVGDSVAAILRETEKATIADSGEFLNWNGKRYPW
jgi:NAD(P)-dependent dehydrogenase (short-subunit alcohol dehydrogenase family)